MYPDSELQAFKVLAKRPGFTEDLVHPGFVGHNGQLYVANDHGRLVALPIDSVALDVKGWRQRREEDPAVELTDYVTGKLGEMIDALDEQAPAELKSGKLKNLRGTMLTHVRQIAQKVGAADIVSRALGTKS